MPTFRNTTRKSIDIIHNGRKIKILPGHKIEGPIHFNKYSGLKIINDSDNNVSQQKRIITTELSSPSIQKNINKTKKEKRKIRKIIKNNNTTPVSQENLNLMQIPESYVIFDEDDAIKEIDEVLSYINEYPKDNLPSVAICILSKNSLELIRDCCDSIIKEVLYPNTKVYIFDTGTTDSHVLNYYNTLKLNKEIKFEVKHVGNFHFSKNYNDGINGLNEDIVLIQNNDTKALNDYVTRLVKLVIVNKVGIAGPRMLFKNNTIQHDGQILFDNTKTKFVNPGHVNYGQPHSEIVKGIHITDGITAAGVMMRTKWFQQLGGFDEGFKDIYQDVHFCMKNKIHGKISVCNRNAIINHYDNTSRKNLWNDHNKVLDMNRDHNFLFNKIKNKEIVLKHKQKRKFSIITLVNNIQQYNDFLMDLKHQKTHASFEIIPLPNFNNEYKSVAEAYNIGIDISQSQYNIFCHQDLRIPNDWLHNIEKSIEKLDSQNINWGVIGMAGAFKGEDGNEYGATYLQNKFNESDPNSPTTASLAQQQYGDYQSVQCLDELCLIVKATRSIKFDSNTFNHFHFYGADYCLQYLEKGYTNFAINSPCTHLSDGFSNLLKEEHSKQYLESSIKLYKKWGAKFNNFRTMTNSYYIQDDFIYYYVAQELNKNGNNFPERVKVNK